MDFTVGIYWCTKCNANFPFVVGRRGLKLIETDKLEELHDKIKAVDKVKQELMKKVDRLEQEKAMVEESLVLARLEDRAENLKVEISLLKEVKRELESMIKYLEHAPSLKVATSEQKSINRSV
ncbi:MAG: hypothetical protein H3Z50_03955 [archaeon]|nr:hypothetical protein [archaeon]MCP8306583.1 hypothetical protein [archaeon]